MTIGVNAIRRQCLYKVKFASALMSFHLVSGFLFLIWKYAAAAIIAALSVQCSSFGIYSLTVFGRLASTAFCSCFRSSLLAETPPARRTDFILYCCAALMVL